MGKGREEEEEWEFRYLENLRRDWPIDRDIDLQGHVEFTTGAEMREGLREEVGSTE